MVCFDWRTLAENARVPFELALEGDGYCVLMFTCYYESERVHPSLQITSAQLVVIDLMVLEVLFTVCLYALASVDCLI